MSLDKQDDNLQEMLNSQVVHLKEEIRATFSRHRKSLASRELWLLDQVDSIKEGTLVMVVKRQISLAEVKGKLEECTDFMSFSMDHEYVEAITRASEVTAQLQKKVQEFTQSDHAQFPPVKFMHDGARLQDAIMSYGSLETKSCSDADETESFSTEKSWDLVDEREDEDGEGNVDTSDFRNKCCSASNACCKQMFEIEDMDFSSVIDNDNLFQAPIRPGFDSSEILKKVCKANELCSSISECVCDTPCLKMPVEKNKNDETAVMMDPVSELHGKLTAIYAQQQEDQEDIPHIVNDGTCENPVAKAQSLTMESIAKPIKEEYYCEDLGFDDPLLQITNTIQSILGTSIPANENNGSMKEYNSSKFEERDIVDELHSKIQCIFDGEKSDVETMICRDDDLSKEKAVKNEHFPRPADESEKKYQMEFGRSEDEVLKLQKRLAEIYQEDVLDESVSEVNKEMAFSDSDPVNLLSSQLRQILAR